MLADIGSALCCLHSGGNANQADNSDVSHPVRICQLEKVARLAIGGSSSAANGASTHGHSDTWDEVVCRIVIDGPEAIER